MGDYGHKVGIERNKKTKGKNQKSKDATRIWAKNTDAVRDWAESSRARYKIIAPVKMREWSSVPVEQRVVEEDEAKVII